MENASKALIIAGAILISILIIALGVFIYNNAANTVKSADMTEYELQAFNSKFEKYLDGGNTSGSPITYANAKGLIEAIRTNNNNSNNSQVSIGIWKPEGGPTLACDASNYAEKLSQIEKNKNKKFTIVKATAVGEIYQNGIFKGLTIKIE